LGQLRPYPLSWIVSDPQTRPFYKCYRHEFGRCRSSGWCVITEILRQSLTLCVPPFKVTRGHWNWHCSIAYLWHPI